MYQAILRSRVASPFQRGSHELCQPDWPAPDRCYHSAILGKTSGTLACLSQPHAVLHTPQPLPMQDLLAGSSGSAGLAGSEQLAGQGHALGSSLRMQ